MVILDHPDTGPVCYIFVLFLAGAKKERSYAIQLAVSFAERPDMGPAFVKYLKTPPMAGRSQNGSFFIPS